MKKFGVIAVALVLVAVGMVAAQALNRSGREDIYLEGKGDVGPRPFTRVAYVDCPPGSSAEDACVMATDEGAPVTVDHCCDHRSDDDHCSDDDGALRRQRRPEGVRLRRR